MNKKEFITELAKLRPSSTFLTLQGYRNEYSEIADYSIIFHMNYKSAVERSIKVIKSLSVSNDLEEQARTELLRSFNRSLLKMKQTPMEELEDAYQHFLDEDGNYVKGIKIHTKTSILHLYGLVVYKRILMPGYYPSRDEAPFAMVKRKMRRLTPVGKYRQFKIQPSQVDKITVENLSLLPPL